MLLTIKQPSHHGFKSFHDYTPPTPPTTARFSPAVTSTGPSFPPVNSRKALPPLPPSDTGTQQPMSTPHRGLPPPAAMTLPQPQLSQQPQPINQPPLSQPMGQLPAPPQQWQGAEESMRNWLLAKSEEDKRKQEEEKTRQESLRLEQRKIEQDMLRTSLTGGVPPYMIPMVFAGMGGGNLSNASLEWAQHYMAQAHQQVQLQQQPLLPSQSHASPEQHQRRDSRSFAPQHSAPLPLPSTPMGPASAQQNIAFVPSSQMSPRSRQITHGHPQAGSIRPQQASSLPRLNTGEMHIQAPPTGPISQNISGPLAHPLQQSQTVPQQESQSSPSIYFHHWQPPTSQASTSGANQPPTTPSDHTSSPKKRKATGPQQAAPPPTSQPQYTSPPFSQGGSSMSNTPQSRRRGHSRQRSDISSRGFETYNRPGSRQRQTEGGFTTRGMASPNHGQGFEQGPSGGTEPRRRSGGSNPVSALLDHGDARGQSQSQSQSQRQQIQSNSQYSAGPEMRHHDYAHEQRTTPEDEGSRRGHKVIKRDDSRD